LLTPAVHIHIREGCQVPGSTREAELGKWHMGRDKPPQAVVRKSHGQLAEEGRPS